MIPETNLLSYIAEHNVDRTKTFAEFIATILNGKLIEIYLGDSYEEINVEQISTSYPAVFCGKVIGAYKECLIINSVFVDKKDNKVKKGNLMFINERSIRALNEIDRNGIMEDMFLRSKESLEIENAFKDG